MIIVDVHEPEELKKIADDVRDLGFDYWIIGENRQYFIERKTLIDMLGSLRGKAGSGKVKERFVEQLNRIKILAEEGRMRGEEAYAILILEGNQFKRYNAKFAKMTRQQWFGIQAKVAELGIGLIRTWSINETKTALSVLNKRAGKEVRELPSLAVDKSLRDTKVEAVHVLMAISSIGEKTAIKLLNRFGSVENIVKASEKDLESVVSEKIAKHIKEVFGYSYQDKLKGVFRK